MEKVKTYAEQRLRMHLMKRHKVKGRGIGEGRFPSVDLYRRHGADQTSYSCGLAISACHGVKNIGKPCAGKPHARFDEGGQAQACSL